MSERKDKERILIVDDDEGTCKSLSLILGRKGYETDTAGTGGEALEKAKGKPFNLVLLDIRLADADGLELIAPLKELNPDMEIVMATGYASVENAVQALNRRAAAYFTKPLNMDEVLTTVVNILDKQLLVRDKRQAEEALTESEDMLRTTLETIGDGITITDMEGIIVSANDAMCQMGGWRKEEVIGKQGFDFMVEQDRDKALESMMKAFGQGESIVTEYRLLNKDGREYPVEASAVLLRNASGDPVGLISVVRDVTERKQAEESFKQYARELGIRNRIAEVFLNVSDEDMYSNVLSIMLEAVESKYGVFGYLDEGGNFVVPTMTRTVWKKCQVPDKSILFPRETWGDSSWPRAIREKRTIFLNEPSIGIPGGHIPIERHISMPLIHQGKVIGLIQVANKKTAYTPEDIALLETIGGSIAPVLDARLKRERQETARRQAEERIEHLNAVLRAIRYVNQLIIREKDRTRLLQGICDNLTEARGYHSCWAALLDETGSLVTCAETGLGKDFKPVARLLKEGKLTKCAKRALKKPEIILVEDAKQACKDCPLSEKHQDRGAMVVRLKHEGRVYGLLSVSVPAHVIADEEELSLFREMTSDISFALHSIEQGEERERAGEELRRSEENYRAVFEGTIDGMVVIDAETMKAVLANEAAFRMYGFDPGTDISQIDPLEHVHPDDRERAFNTMAEDMFSKNLGETVEFRTLTRDGDVKWVSGRGKVIDYQGRSAGLVSFRDVTAQKQAQEALKESEEKYRDLVERERDVIFSVDAVGNITSINSASRIWGYEPEDLIGRNFLELVPEEWQERTAVELQNLLLEAGELTAETVVTASNGEHHTIEYSATVIQEGGEYAGVQGIVRDVTERKQAEEALKESEIRYRNLVESSPHGIQEIDTNGIIIYTNPAYREMLGYTEEELVGKSVLDLLEPASIQDELRQYLSFLVKEQPQPTIYVQKNRTKDGRIIDQEVAWNYKRDGAKNLIGFISVITDVTERNQVEQALRVSEEKMRTMFSSITDGIILTDLVGNILDVNKATVHLHGYSSKDELIGINGLELIAEESRAGAIEAIVKALEEGRGGATMEYILLRKDGSKADGEGNTTVLEDGEGNPVGIVVITRDVTERKRAEELVHIQRDLGLSLSTAQGLEEVLAVCFNAAMQVSGMDCGGIYLFDEASGSLDMRYHEGLSAEFVSAVSHYDADSDNARLARKGKPLYITHLKLGVPLTAIEKREALRAMAFVPLLHEGKLIGCVNLASHTLDEVPAFNRTSIESTVSRMGSAIAYQQAEEALQQSEERYRSVVETASEAIMVAQDGMLKFFNPRTAEITGYSAEEISLKPFIEFVHPDDRNMVADRYLRRMQGEEISAIYDFRIIDKAGNTRWIQINATLIDWKGRTATLNFLSDITERKQAEEALRESEENYRELFDGAVDGKFVIDAETLKVVLVNKSTLDMFGFDSVEEVSELNLLDYIHPDDRERALKIMTEDMFEKDLRQVNEFRVYTKQGEDRWISAVACKIEYQGRMAGMASFTDITERKRAEEEIRRYARREATLHQVAQAVSQTMDMDEMLNSVLDKLCEVADTTVCGIFLLDMESAEIALKTYRGVSKEFVESLRVIKLGESEIKRALEWQEPVIEPDKLFTRVNADKVAAAVEREGLRWYMLLPFWSKGIPLGALAFGDRRERQFSSDDTDLLNSIGSEIAVGIDNIQLLQRTQALSVTDELTDLYNRRHFYDVLEAEMARTVRFGHPFTLVLLDLDGFKEYNDKFGHINGDAVLRSLGQTLNSTLRRSDTSFRYGGDEFAVILTGTDAQRAKQVIERLRARWQQTPKALYPILETPLGFSAGIAQFPEHADTADGLVFMADSALYHAKEEGGYRAVLASDLKSLSPEILEAATPDHVYALASTVDAKDPYTYGHSKNVADIAQAIGKEIGMSGKELADLRNASLLHDIGKLGIPDAILTKPGKPTEEEWEIIKRHSAEGGRIVSYVKDLSPLVPMIRHHHEWYDGTGYPDGLKGEEIPLGARVISIADAYDTITGKRPYKDPISHEEALEELKRCSGTQFDPEFVEAFCRAMSEVGEPE
jgi:diguanylate cyclase (GGDEF)-like protein/PAS domain S-box-containing protein